MMDTDHLDELTRNGGRIDVRRGEHDVRAAAYDADDRERANAAGVTVEQAVQHLEHELYMRESNSA